MTFSTKLKEEIATNKTSRIAIESELNAIIRYDAQINNNKIILTFENATIARRVYQTIKEIFHIPINIIIRNQKRLRAKQIYILEITKNIDLITHTLHLNKQIDETIIQDPEEIKGFIKGIFLACGSINDPATSGYHLEFVFQSKKDAETIANILQKLKLKSKVTERNNRYMVYLKSSEDISDIIKLFEATNSLFYFEDIRIYRDHKNMINRLNNCDIANQEKALKTAINQLKDIQYLKQHQLIDLLDDKAKIIIKAREENPESSYQELAQIITEKYNYKISKSGINHHFIKIKKLIENSKRK